MSSPPTIERDPVCGMNVNPQTAKHSFSQAGKTYYFCCPSCLEKFKADPPKYLNTSTKPSGLVTLGFPQPAGSHHPAQVNNATSSAPTAVYVCPMCPEVRQTKPGACPSCGMALEPVEIVSTEQEARAAVDNYARLGYLQIKIYSSVSPTLVPAIIDEAHKKNLKVVADAFSLADANRSIVHVLERMNGHVMRRLGLSRGRGWRRRSTSSGEARARRRRCPPCGAGR